MAKLMVSLRDENFRILCLEARERGITIQELIRAVIVPDWVRFSNILAPRTEDLPLQTTMIRHENEISPILGRPKL